MKIKCSQCNHKMTLKEEIDSSIYKPTLICPNCGFSIENEIDMNEVEKKLHEIESGPKGRLLIHLRNMKEIKQLKELIPEIKDIPISQLSEELKNADMKWRTEEDYLMLIESTLMHAKLLGLEAEIIKT